jgi:uncharacterized protein YqgC (DUF456 family)
MKSILKKILGVILIIVGLAALFTPLTPGSWLALIGLELAGFGFLLENRIGRAIKNKFKNSKRKFKKNPP